MEQVLVLNGSWLGSRDESEINRWLEKGWTVKSVTSGATEAYVTFVIVLEKN